jgi:hypothetical protein
VEIVLAGMVVAKLVTVSSSEPEDVGGRFISL